jgi:hypothetical protein
MAKPDRAYFEAMRDRALVKLEGDLGYRALVAEAKAENGPNWVYVNARLRNNYLNAENNLHVAEVMLRQLAKEGV